MNKKRTICIVLVAQLSFNLFLGNITAKADSGFYTNETIAENIEKNYNHIEKDDNEIIWGEDRSYNWFNSKCKINNVGFELNSDNTTVSIYVCNYKKSAELVLPHKIKVGEKYYSVTSIGDYSFCGCKALRSITIPDSVTSIGNGAFVNCDKLSSIKIPDSVMSIGNEAFVNCSSLSEIVVPKGITSIGDYTFCDCKSLNSITIPDGVTSIGDYSFFGCRNLRSIAISDSVVNIGECAFEVCNNLNLIWASQSQYNKLKDGLSEGLNTKLIEFNFYNIQDNVIEIKADKVTAYEKLSDGTAREIPLELNDEGYYVHDPKSEKEEVKTYYYAAVKDGIEYTSPLITVKCHNINNSSKEENIHYRKTSENAVSIESCDSNLSGNITIPKTVTINNDVYKVTAIDKNAFSGCCNLESVTIQDGIESIGDWSFTNCNNLKSIIISDSVKSIGEGAFALCDNLQEVKLPKNLNKISSFMFNGCSSLERIQLPEGLKEIQTYAFINCKNLEEIYIPDSIETIQNGAFINLNENTLFYVKNKDLELLLNNCGIDSKHIVTEEWNKDNQCYIDNVKYQLNDDNTVSVIGYNKNLGSNLILNSKITVGQEEFLVKDIGESAFSNSNIESLTINGISKIGAFAFSACKNLETADISDGVTSIEEGAFTLCESLKEVKFSNDLTNISSLAFNNCLSLERLQIPNSPSIIETYAFINCKNLKSVIIPARVKEIQISAFLGISDDVAFFVEDDATKKKLKKAGVDFKYINQSLE